MARMSGAASNVTRIDDHPFRVETDGREELVYVALHQGRYLAWWNGRAFEVRDAQAEPRRTSQSGGAQVLTAPMPARVLKVNAAVGDHVRKGDSVVILEAMKMEWPIRATADGIVTSVACREGTLVSPDAPLVEIAAP
jgi:biotin carboxyl carrier protein